MLRRTSLKRGNKPLQRTSTLNRISERKKEELKERKEEKVKMKEWFKEIWDEREDENGFCYCFETGKPMHRKVFREIIACYDHVLEKQENQFPQYKFTKKNIVIILPSIHAQKGMDITKTPKIAAYKQELLNLHYNNELND